MRAATAKEQSEQAWLAGTADFTEGVSATAERREPRFTGSCGLAGALAVVDSIDGAVDGRGGIAGKECDDVRNVEGMDHAAR